MPFYGNNSRGGSAELKVCHGVWEQPLRETTAFIFNREVMGRVSLEGGVKGVGSGCWGW